MSLLNDLFARPLEPEYEEVAARERAATEASRSSGGGLRFTPVLILGTVTLGLILTMAALQVRNTQDARSSERAALVERITTEDDRVTRLQETVQSLEAEINGLESTLLENSTAGRRLRDEVERLQAGVGSVAMTGPGVVITVDDADPASFDEAHLAAVQDVDLRQVVNGLWAAGAEAVSINGQRITPLTSIRRVNDIMQINYRPTQSPFEITAIGDARTLPSAFGDGTGGGWLRRFALPFDVRSAESLTVPASSTSLAFAQPVQDR